MGQRRKAGDGARLPDISRRAVIGVAGLPLAGPVRGSPAPSAADIPAQCAAVVRLEGLIDQSSNRWTDLEKVAIREFDYFNLSDTDRLAFPTGREMAVVDAECRRLHAARENALGPLEEAKPHSVQDAVALLSIAYHILKFEEGDAWPYVQKAWSYLSESRCPGCGAAHLPEGFPR